MSKEGCNVNRFSRSIYKYLTLLLFLILPVRFTKVFLELSIAALITDLRGKDCLDKCFNVDKFSKLLNTAYNEDIAALPTYTISWFWPEKTLNKTLHLREGDYTIKQTLCDDKLLKHNLGAVTNIIMSQLPYLMKVKLGLKNNRSRLTLRHEIMSVMTQGLQPV